MLGLSTKLLAAFQSKSDLKRGRDTQQLDLGYLDSPLNLEQPARVAGLRAGDRAPDAPVWTADGVATRLFSLLHGAHWTLLGYELGENDGPTRRSGLQVIRIGTGENTVDREGCLREYYGLTSGDWVLVRPDGYVAAIAASTGFVGIEQLLKKVLPDC
jgi:hypothetical protein